MDKIAIQILNPSAIKESEQMMVCAARLTQKGHMIQNLQDFMDLYNKDYSETTVKNMTALPHPTIQKFGVVNIVIVGASRRFLAQITRHQNEVKFMSASLQYSDYSGKAGYTVPYDILGTEKEAGYLAQCEASMQKYMSLVTAGISNDDCAARSPQYYPYQRDAVSVEAHDTSKNLPTEYAGNQIRYALNLASSLQRKQSTLFRLRRVLYAGYL